MHVFSIQLYFSFPYAYSGSPPSEPLAQSPPAPPAAVAVAAAPKDYKETRIQVRLASGQALTQTFNVKEPLSAVRLFVQLNQASDIPFALMTTFPRKVFGEEDYDTPLEALGLVPSAVVIVTKISV